LRPFPGKDDCLLLDLTVVDTRALEIGDLFGRMMKCHECECEYLSGLPKCPRCGAVPLPPEKREAGEIVEYNADHLPAGEELQAEFGNLFEKAFAAWHMDADGFMSCGLGYDNGALIIMPPLVDEMYRLGRVPKVDSEPVYMISLNEDLASLMLEAEKFVRTHGNGAERTAQKDAAWRADPPTRGQLRFMKKLGVTAPANITKGGASQLITHAIYVKRAATEPWSAQV